MDPRDTALIDTIYLHHSKSAWGTLKDITAWHIERGFDTCGYNRVICNAYPTYKTLFSNTPNMYSDGKVEIGRPDDVVPAGVKGENTHSVHICIIGVDQFTGSQVRSVKNEINDYIQKYPNIKYIKRHSDDDPKKPDCPGLSDAFMRHLKAEAYNFIGPRA